MGGKETEKETFKRLLTEVYPTGIVSVVADTWDFWSVIDHVLPELKDVILNRDGKIVIRPDSGDPVDIICGNVTAVEIPDSYATDLETMKSYCRDYIVDLVLEKTKHLSRGSRGSDTETVIFKYKEKYYSCSAEIGWDRILGEIVVQQVEFEETELNSEQKGAVER
jgi:nicotinamide phosphoribosyltransferase